MAWQEVFRGKFEFNADAARAIHGEWRKKAPSENEVSKSSLATRIGDLLAHGDRTGWWSKRPKLSRILAESLDLEPSDVFGSAPVAEGTLAFSEFPLLQPLQRDEDPCDLVPQGWLLDTVLRLMGSHGREGLGSGWVVAPPGAGKSLVVRYLQARLAGEVFAASVDTVASAAAHAGTELSLVIEVEDVDPVRDLESLRRLAERGAPTVVLAPFSFPEAPWFGASSRAGFTKSGWTTIDATPSGHWRERLVEWIEARLHARDRETWMAKEDVLQWLERFDPSSRLLPTPGDVLALCSDFDRHGGDSAGLVERSRRWLAEVGRDLFPTEVPASWRKHVSARAFHALAWRHAQDLGRKFGSLDGAAWTNLVDAETAQAPTSRRPGSAVVVGYMRESGLMRGASAGLGLYPTWVERGAVTEELHREFEERSVEAWGRLAADETRQSTVDAALDALSGAAFKALVRALGERSAPVNLAQLAAVESTIAALGRRLARSGVRLSERDVAAAQQLMLHQVDALVLEEGYREVHHPFTRRTIDEWFVTGWAVSLRVPAPSAFSRADLSWELPRWAERLSLSAMPQHGFPGSFIGPSRASPCVQSLAALASEVVKQIEAAELPASVNRLLLPALFLSPTEWPLTHEHLAMLHGTWEEHYLAAEAKGLSADRRVVLAGRIWRLVARTIVEDGAVPVAERIAFLRERHPALVELILSNVDPDELAQTARTHGIHRRPRGKGGYAPSDPCALLDLPRPGRQGALRAWLEGAMARGARFDEARELLPLLDPEDIDLAIEMARSADSGIATEFTDFVWTTSAERAREEARVAVESGLPSVQGWFYRAPRSQLPYLVGLIGNQPATPEWVSRWAMRRVLDGGEAADQLYRLTKSGR